MSKGDPVPTRFDPPEDEALKTLKLRTGLSNAEIVRRAMRLLRKRFEKLGTVGFILDELAPKIAEDDPEAAAKKVVKAPSARRKVSYSSEKKRKKRA
jgi:hypothetical protein